MTPDSSTGEYVLYADKRKMTGNLNKRMLFVCVPLILCIFALVGGVGHELARTPAPFSHPGPPVSGSPSPFRAVFFWLPWFLVAECLFLWWVIGRAHRKPDKPIIVLSPHGLSVDTLATHIGLMSWEEIGEVRVYNLGYRYVGVVPRDAKTLYRRLGMRRSWLLWLNTACIPLYQLFGIFVAPINIPQAYLPVPADELAAMLHSYQVAYGHRSDEATPAEGTWPPPPTVPRPPSQP